MRASRSLTPLKQIPSALITIHPIMALNTHPLEILTNIICFVPPGSSRTALACVSRYLQQATELFTFQHIKLESSPASLSTFERYFSHVSIYRRTILRTLEYEIVVPEYGFRVALSMQEIAKNVKMNEIVASSITEVLRVLRSWIL